jgi:hypothetical protein
MGFEFKEKLSPNEKTRRAKEYTEWLIKEGFLPDHSLALLEAQHLLNELQNELDKTGHSNTAMSKLAAHTQEILTTIK